MIPVPEFFGKVNRAQRTMLFKVIASGLVVALAAVFIINYAVEQRRLGAKPSVVVETANPGENLSALTPEQVKQREAARADAEANAQYINDLLARRADWTGAAVVSVLLTGLLLGFVWLGLGAVAPILLGLIALVAWRLKLFSPQDVGFEELNTLDVILLFVGAVAVLTCSFLALMELLKIVFGAPTQVMAIARNVVNEAVRLKVSLVLIVLLIFGLAALPGLLDPGTPLRYRVQAFLEYGTGGAFLVIAVLVLFLAVGSVSFEQRDRVIWQTMTKPVAAWQYLLGKWLGVVGVAAVLLMVSASGVFAFTEYLSRQKASGELRPYVAAGQMFISEDRDVLETQVLASRRTIAPEPPVMSREEVDAEIDRRIERTLRQSGVAPTREAINEMRTPETMASIERELLQEHRDQFISIEPGRSQVYYFNGLSDARRTTWESVESAARRMGHSMEEMDALIAGGRLLSRVSGGQTEIGTVSVKQVSLRYKVQAGGNDPRTTVHLTFIFTGQSQYVVREASLNTTMTLRVPPSAIDQDGRLRVEIYNGDANTQVPNDGTISLPLDTFSVYYAAGSYRMNFLRVVVILWLKLAFLAMVAIVSATFLSFSVASMISFGILLIAEGASFVWEALNYYDAAVDGELVFHRLIIRIISLPIAWTFKHYSEIMPIQGLANGELVSWSTVLWGLTLLGGTCAVLYAVGVVIFRRRELATYSGQ